METIREQVEKIASEICDNYCKYPNEPGHEDDPDWLFREGIPCDNCPMNRLL